MGFSRRRFIECSCKSLAAVTAASYFRRFGMMNAYAQGVNDYKALVCIFLSGGNDSNNMVIPMDGTGFSDYSATGVRNNIALTQGQALPIALANAQGAYASNQFGLHPSLIELQALFNTGKLAVAANVGPLVRPTTRTQYLNRSVQLPTNLFSHSDQQNEWQTSAPNSLSSIGWGGRIADAMQYANAGSQYPMTVSLAGAAPFAVGQQSVPVTLVPQNAVTNQTDPNYRKSPDVTGVNCSSGSSQSNSTTCAARTNAMQNVLTMDTGLSLVQAASDTMNKSFLYSSLLNSARSGAAAFNTSFQFNNGNTLQNTSFGNQLRQVAEIIQVHQALGVNRQIFFVSIGGFDTHSGQGVTFTNGNGNDQPGLLRQLSQGMNALWSALGEIGMQNNVAIFTLSDFARTLQSNTGGGTDHAWGSHQFVLGGNVLGGDMYGAFPVLKLGSAGPNDAGSNGRWIPTSSIDQFGAALASWFGVGTSNLPAIFPNLPNFNNQKMGFLG